MSLVPALALDPELAPLMLELQASSSPPPPTTAALAPAARSRPRRLIGDSLPRGPNSWGDPSPQLPLVSVLSLSEVWSLMCNRSPLRSRRGAGPRLGDIR